VVLAKAIEKLRDKIERFDEIARDVRDFQ
jgi:hypothetical protein